MLALNRTWCCAALLRFPIFSYNFVSSFGERAGWGMYGKKNSCLDFWCFPVFLVVGWCLSFFGRGLVCWGHPSMLAGRCCVLNSSTRRAAGLFIAVSRCRSVFHVYAIVFHVKSESRCVTPLGPHCRFGDKLLGIGEGSQSNEYHSRCLSPGSFFLRKEVPVRMYSYACTVSS